jgi:hydroxyacylglutathione hydrolase
MNSIQPKVYHKVIGPMGNNCFLILDQASNTAAIVDPGYDAVSVLDLLPNGAKVDHILITHGHFDHVAGVADVVEETGANIVIHSADTDLMLMASDVARSFGMSCPTPPEPHSFFDGLTEFWVGSVKLEIRHIPGHSPGGVALVVGELVIVGDALFAGSIGRTDLPGADHQVLIESIRTQLLVLPDETQALPGHGPFTTIGQERRSNPFLV